MSELGNFMDDHGLWSDDQRAQAAEIRSQIEAEGLEAVRVSWPDQHGLLRGKSLSIPAFEAALRNGSEISMAPVLPRPGQLDSCSTPSWPEAASGSTS